MRGGGVGFFPYHEGRGFRRLVSMKGETIKETFAGNKTQGKKVSFKPNLEVLLGGIRMKNPVMVASGTFGYGEEYSSYVDLNRLGAIVVKGTTLKPREGNPPPRIVETPAGILNAIGLQNVGIEVFLKEKMSYLRQFDTAIIVNIAGERIEEYIKLAEILDEVEGIAGLELNISCPNVKKGGSAFGANPEVTYEVVSRVRRVTHLPLIVKLSPNVGDIASIAHRAEEAGADVLSLINTLLGMAIDIEARRPILANITGGLSGPAIKPIALRMVWQVAKAVKIPVVGMGGITTVEDALEFIIAGARAVAIGTANFIEPRTCINIIEGLEKYLKENNIADIRELIGSLRV